ncbi:hypothetical protein GCM10010095_20490 [Streptomyces anthocyanicus]|nr:hypothetical protein GCM10010095_20490 [Streptomyces anthocyanicus]
MCWTALAVVFHLVGCVHGPSLSGAGQVDALPLQAVSTSHPAHGAAQVTVGEGLCERHHGGVQECAGADEPAVGQAESGRELLSQSAVLVSALGGQVAPVRGPPCAGTAGPGSGTVRAVLQVWRT